jgi:hypothetical protein
MLTQIQEKIEKLMQTTFALGKVGFLVVENKQEINATLPEAKKALLLLSYEECTDYLELMDALSASKNKIFYLEKDDKFNSLVLEIVAEFESGIVSLADRKNQTGLKTAKWNPFQTSLIIIMTREQVEKSYPRLFEYVGATQSL